MLLYVLVLRLLHIVAAAFWAGGSFMIAGFIMPTVSAAGPEGGKFMQVLVQRSRLPVFMNWSSWIATISGVLLYWQVSGGMQPAWITSGSGLGFTLGSLAGITAFLTGHFINGRAAARMGEIARQVQAAGGPPKPEQAAELQSLQGRIRMGSHLGAALLAIALILMAVSRSLR